MHEVTCLGILVADVVAKTVDKIPQRGQLELVDRIELHNGGGAINTGNALAKVGVSTAIIAKVGCDGFGDFLINVAKEYGVDTRGIVRDERTSTSATMVLVDSTGERSFLHHIGANGELTAEDVDFSIIEEGKLLHVAYAFLMPKLDGPPTVEILRRAKERGIITSLDTVWDAKGRWLEVLEPYFPYLDIFLPSYEEARRISGRDDPRDIAAFFLDYGIGTVGIKMGEQGCYVRRGEESVRLPRFVIPEVVDTTGAGDCWVAGFLTGVVRGWDLEETARFANALGALCCTDIGASRGIRTMEETLSFIASTPLAE